MPQHDLTRTQRMFFAKGHNWKYSVYPPKYDDQWFVQFAMCWIKPGSYCMCVSNPLASYSFTRRFSEFVHRKKITTKSVWAASPCVLFLSPSVSNLVWAVLITQIINLFSPDPCARSHRKFTLMAGFWDSCT